MNNAEFEIELKSLIAGLSIGEFKKVYGDGGLSMYVTPCAKGCGTPVKSWSRRKNVQFKCSRCKQEEKEVANGLKKRISILTLERRIEASKEYIVKMYGKLDEYEDAFKKIEKHMEKAGWFQSTNEVLVAVELIRSKITARHQVKMGKWRVDFLLPDYKTILEIDGKYHEYKDRGNKDKIKDAAIIASLGPEWEIVRIKDEILKQNLKKLVPAIKSILTNRRKVRKSHGGQLPNNYSNNAI